MSSQETRSIASRGMSPILLVEDNEMDIDLMLQAFEEHKIANPVVICRDGEEAIQYIETHTSGSFSAIGNLELPVLVLLDLRLPKVDGIEVLERAKQDSIWKQVPFVVLTTSREHVDVGRAYDLGANSYIVKPVDFIDFVEVIKTIKIYWLLANEPPYSSR